MTSPTKFCHMDQIILWMWSCENLGSPINHISSRTVEPYAIVKHLFKVSYVLNLLAFFITRNCQKFQKFRRTVKIKKENLHIFEQLDELEQPLFKTIKN